MRKLNQSEKIIDLYFWEYKMSNTYYYSGRTLDRLMKFYNIPNKREFITEHQKQKYVDNYLKEQKIDLSSSDGFDRIHVRRLNQEEKDALKKLFSSLSRIFKYSKIKNQNDIDELLNDLTKRNMDYVLRTAKCHLEHNPYLYIYYHSDHLYLNIDNIYESLFPISLSLCLYIAYIYQHLIYLIIDRNEDSMQEDIEVYMNMDKIAQLEDRIDKDIEDKLIKKRQRMSDQRIKPNIGFKFK